MPELPEVETIVQELKASLEKQVIEKAIIYWERTIATPHALLFAQNISGQMIHSIQRRGKFLVFHLSQETLLIHLRMTGKLLLSSSKEEAIQQHERVRLYLTDGRVLHYYDQRKFGKWYLLKNPEEKLQEIGLEPLSEAFTLATFQALIKKQQISIKSFLLNQKYVCGLGNIYVDEALWEAKIHPARKLSTLNLQEINDLYHAIIKVLKKGVDHAGTSLGMHLANYVSLTGKRGGNQYLLNVFRREGKPCFKCQTLIVKETIAQRGTHFCPQCQLYS